MNARRLGVMIGLEMYAIALAMAQYFFIGVRTEEAMALLNIPSSQPPLARFLLNLLDGWAYQEIFWRIVFATLLVQAVWLVMDLARGMSPSIRASVAAAWLLSAPMVLQAGTVMMAPLTALQGLVFVWLTMENRTPDSAPIRTQGRVRLDAWGIGIVWLASLFTAYQAVLFAPVVWGALRSQDGTPIRTQGRVRLGIWLVPILLLGLYALTNPLALMDMVPQVPGNIALIADRSRDAGWTLLLGGSGILSVMGIIGLLFTHRWALLCSLFLVLAYILVFGTGNDAMLLLPLLIAGLAALARRWRVAVGTAVLVPVGTLVLLWSSPQLLPMRSMDAAGILATIGATDRPGAILIAGPFGHEWQYASERPVRRYAARHLSEAAAVVCLQPCEEMERQEGWERIREDPVAVWMPKR